MPEVGQLIHNKYRLVRLIGDGGMGSVYEAHHEVLGTNVALKFLHPELARRGGLVQRFLQEARVSARIQSPHVVRVTDVDQTPEGLAFIVMEFLKGKSLQNMYEDLYRAGKRLSYEEGLDYAVQMMEGLEAAHAEGVVHRDLKPDNVMITKNRKGVNELKVLDFGIAKLKVEGDLGKKGLTRPGVVMGTPEYMAPEQAFSADAVDARADIFSLGVMVFEMLAGRRPVGGDEAHQIAAQYLTGQVAKLSDLMPNIPEELCAAVHKAMAASKENRFASVAEFREIVEPFADAVKKPKPVGATPAGDSGGAAKVTPSEQAAVAQSAPDASDAPAPSPAPAASPAPSPPATNVPSQEPSSELPPRVAKTLPPDDESGVPPPAQPGGAGDGARMGIVAPSIPPAYDQTSEGLGKPSHPMIPVGDATEEQEPLDAQARHEAETAAEKAKKKAKKTGTEIMKAPEGAEADSAKKHTPEPGASPAAASVGAMPATRTAAPLESAVLAGPQLTEEGAPIAAAATPAEPAKADAANGFGATLPADATAPGFDPNATEPFDAGAARPGGTAVGDGPGTMDMQPGVAAQPAPSPRVVAAPAGPHSRRRGRGKKAGGLSVFGILMLAAGIAGAVTGGVYLASEYGGSSADGDDDTEIIETKKKKKSKKKKAPSGPSQPVVVAGDPTTPPDPTVDDPATAEPPPPPTSPPPPPPPTAKPSASPKPTSSGSSKPPPSAAPTPTFTVPILPSAPPVLPSNLPNILPGLGRLPGKNRPPPASPPPSSTATGPTKPPPPPPPPPPTKKRPRFRIPGKSTQIDPATIGRGDQRIPMPNIVTGARRRSAGSRG